MPMLSPKEWEAVWLTLAVAARAVGSHANGYVAGTFGQLCPCWSCRMRPCPWRPYGKAEKMRGLWSR